MIWLLWAAGIPLVGFILIALQNTVFGPRLSTVPDAKNQASVSILVPARNEESTIRECVEGLLNQDYPFFEILVLNDQSDDRTGDIVQELASQHPKVRYIEGKAPPERWSGKNWACHQLQQRAAGELLIFTDADNSYHPKVVSNTVGMMERYRLGMFSAFPQQITLSLAEKLVVPMVELFFYAFLPHWLILYSRFPSVAAANGQWIAFTRDAYKKLGGHESLKESVVEDVQLARQAKRAGIRSLAGSGKGRVFGRMYSDWRGVWEGFSKNLFQIGGGSTLPYIGLLAGLFMLFVLPYVFLFIPHLRTAGIILVSLNVLLRFILGIGTGHRWWEGIFLHPFGTLATLAIAWNSLRWYQRGEIRWKGRSVHPVAGRSFGNAEG